MKPKEVDYTSHVAYTRALEEYCEGLQKAAQMAIQALTLFATPNWAGSGVNEVNAAIKALRKELE